MHKHFYHLLFYVIVINIYNVHVINIFKELDMKNFSILLSTVAIILAACALVTSLKSGKATVSSEEVAQILKTEPKMVVDALQAFQEQERAEQERAAREAMAKYADEINSSANAPFVGPEDAKVVVVEFFDFSCGYCKRLAPTIKKLVADNADVKFIFKPLSFVSPVSGYQAKAAFAAHKQGKFVEFYNAVLDFQGRMTEASVDEIAKSLVADYDKYKADVNSEEVKNALEEIRTLSRNVQINGVPHVLINGQQAEGISVDALQNAINNAK